ncbi:hypothetical protein QBC37DRAFT_416246 [Rhypophila decipiens]|uniref:BZIP domain-containing protein n=1 Tax=Rhypophila decipiens TaxID=261697 RepID=A0AAN6YIK9_9PEZI|nr:hypothetical protein QBC37DRAFT_416246 [Rhypophila decipiens]
MESWSTHTPVSLKFENSPTESLLSTPDEMYPSLFGNDLSTSTMNPMDVMTPRSSFSEQPESFTDSRPVSEAPQTPGANDADGKPEQKPVKKRKSWGQVLPEPKTNLPPRKRARTADEKEQRRVERVLRNRRAAQSSRERKRQEVEGLEKRNQELEAALRKTQEQLQMVCSELQRVKGGSAIVGIGSGLETLGQAPVTLSQPLFGAQQQQQHAQPTNAIDDFLNSLPSNQNTTVNPASLSPTLSPVPEEGEDVEATAAVTSLAAATVTQMGGASDETQHPAAMLCQGLQCPSVQAPPSKWLLASQPPSHPALALLQVLVVSTSAMVSICQRPLTQIAMSLKAGFSLPPTPQILNTIIWLVTTPQSSRPSRQTSTSTSTTSLPTSSSRSTNPTAARQQSTRSSTLRLKSLRKILTCSPDLARPLMDATLAALRLASSEADTVEQVPREDDVLAAASPKGATQRQQKRPSKEVLLTLAWVLTVEQRRLEIRKQLSGSGKTSVTQTTTPTTSTSFKVVSKKRGLEQSHQATTPSSKRKCFE